MKLIKGLIMLSGVLYLSGQVPTGLVIRGNKLKADKGYILIVNGVRAKEVQIDPNNDYKIEVEYVQ